MSVGDIVWSVIAAAWVLAAVGTSLVREAPGPARVVRAFLGSWAGRAVALGAWAEAGWHLFCQRP